MAQHDSTSAVVSDHSNRAATRFRWVICGILFYATTVNYIDRSIVNALAPVLQKPGNIGWTDYQYGLIGAAFNLGYAIGFLIMGRLIDAIGTRLGYAIALVCWTSAAALTAVTRTPLQFGAARFFLGLGEAGNFPAAIKTVAEWFPQRQRAMATGIFNAGSNVGAILAPLLALSIVPLFGWRTAFCVTPVLAIIWIVLWLVWYRSPAKHPRVNAAELALIQSDSPMPSSSSTSAPVRWRNILSHRQTWAFVLGKFLTDPIWWFYLFWSGKFFYERFQVDLKGLAFPLVYIYMLADIGSVAGGWMSSSLLKRGWTANAARKTTMTACAVLILPVIFAPIIPITWTGALWIAATLIGVAAAAHQGFSANIFTLTSDMFPKRAVSSIVGLGGLGGALGGMIMQAGSGVIKEVTGSYVIMFVIAGTVYGLAVIVIHVLAPRLTPIADDELEATGLNAVAWGALFAGLGAVIGVPASYFFLDHSALVQHLMFLNPHPTYQWTGSFAQFLYAVISGDIFRVSPARGQLLRPLWQVPLILATLAAISAVVCKTLARRSRGTASENPSTDNSPTKQ